MQTTFDKQDSSLAASNNRQESKPDPAIKCPYLRLIQPDTSNTWRFTRDCQKNGMSLFTALGITAGTVILQKGKGPLALLRGQAPDLYRLDEVKLISHKDLYLPYLPQVKEKVQALSRNGKISIQDLADIKQCIAAKEGVPVIRGSKIQVVLLFIRAGGDLDTGLIDADDALRMIEGYEPKKSGVVTLGAMKRARKLITWSGCKFDDFL